MTISVQLFNNAISETFNQYVDNTRVNGLWMLRREYPSGPKRYMWVAILIFLCLLGVYLSAMLWDKFYSTPTLVTIETNHPVTSVAFPGVTLCSPQSIVPYKLDQFLSKIEIPQHYTLPDVALALQELEAFTGRQWNQPNQTNLKIIDFILKENNISLYEAARQISGSCDDFLQYCYWGSRQFECQKDAELSFTTTSTIAGFCCSFNYNAENPSHIPFSANNFGVSGGLVVSGLDKIMGNYSSGLILRVHHPQDYPTESDSAVTLNPYSETFVAVYPVELSTSRAVLELTTRKRKCLIASDFNRPYYRQASCRLSCELQVIYRTCGCHPFNFPPLNNRRGFSDCSAQNAICFLQNLDYLKTLKCRHCLPNCYDVTYTTSTDYTGLLQHNISASRIYSSNNLSKDSFIVRVYLAKQIIPSHRKIITMSLIGLLADLGGVFNLCMGISVVSIFEFIYFFTYRLRRNYKSQSAIIIRVN